MHQKAKHFCMFSHFNTIAECASLYQYHVVLYLDWNLPWSQDLLDVSNEQWTVCITWNTKGFHLYAEISKKQLRVEREYFAGML